MLTSIAMYFNDIMQKRVIYYVYMLTAYIFSLVWWLRVGQDIVDMSVSAKDRIKDDELLGKRYSMWTDKVENTIEVVVSHPY